MRSALPVKHINDSMNRTTGAILCQPNAATYCTSATEIRINRLAGRVVYALSFKYCDKR